jgi:hypothetical protein
MLHNILLRFMFKKLQNMSFSKKIKSINKSFHCLQTSITLFNECFCYFLFIELISKQFTCSYDILKKQQYKKILQFQHKIKLQL